MKEAGAPLVLIKAESVDTGSRAGTAKNEAVTNSGHDTVANSERDTVAVPQAPHALLQPVVAAQAAYPFIAALARARGLDPDSPPHLRKITRTL